MIRPKRESNRLTQDQMAERVTVSRQAVSRGETGETQPNTDTLKILSGEFNIPINTLPGSPRPPVCQCCVWSALMRRTAPIRNWQSAKKDNQRIPSVNPGRPAASVWSGGPFSWLRGRKRRNWIKHGGDGILKRRQAPASGRPADEEERRKGHAVY